MGFSLMYQKTKKKQNVTKCENKMNIYFIENDCSYRL